MKSKLITILCHSLSLPDYVSAGIMYEDVAEQDYRDFAENLSKYRVGTENIHANKTDGILAGVIEFPVPDFGVVVSGGFATLMAPSYLASVKHNTGYQSVDFGNNAKYNTSYKLINRNEYEARDFTCPD